MTASKNSDWDGAIYHRLSKPQFQWGLKVLSRMALRGDETILDAGCGTGRLTEKLLEKLPKGRVIAFDGSPSMLKVAREYLGPRFGDRVTFLEGNLENLSLDKIADGIFSTATFHWVKDHSRLFNSLLAALRPGGFLLAQCGGSGNLARWHQRANDLMAMPRFQPFFLDWKEPWNYADAETTARRLREAGFDDVRTNLEPAPTSLDHATTFRDFVGSVNLRHHVAAISSHSAREEFLDALVDQARRDDPPFVLDYWRLNLSGRRPG